LTSDTLSVTFVLTSETLSTTIFYVSETLSTKPSLIVWILSFPLV
jgi:hypothetical protein